MMDRIGKVLLTEEERRRREEALLKAGVPREEVGFMVRLEAGEIEGDVVREDEAERYKKRSDKALKRFTSSMNEYHVDEGDVIKEDETDGPSTAP